MFVFWTLRARLERRNWLVNVVGFPHETQFVSGKNSAFQTGSIMFLNLNQYRY